MLKTPHHALISETAKFGVEPEIVQVLRAELRARRKAQEERANKIVIFALTFSGTMLLVAVLMSFGIIQ